MVDIKRQSPVRFDAVPSQTDERDNWTVALEYENEGQGPWVADLSHKTRWDLQDAGIGEMTVLDHAVPEAPGACNFTGALLINRMNGAQASIYRLGNEAADMPDFSGYTDVTEATVFLAVFGSNAFKVAEKLTNLDFMDPSKQPPFLLQGPFCHVPCQIVTLEKPSDGSRGFLMTCSRGYGDSMLGAIMKAGEEFGLRPAGENRFNAWIRELR